VQYSGNRIRAATYWLTDGHCRNLSVDHDTHWPTRSGCGCRNGCGRSSGTRSLPQSEPRPDLSSPISKALRCVTFAPGGRRTAWRKSLCQHCFHGASAHTSAGDAVVPKWYYAKVEVRAVAALGGGGGMRARDGMAVPTVSPPAHLGPPEIPTWTRNGWWWLLPYQSPTLGRLAPHPPPPWPLPFPSLSAPHPSSLENFSHERGG
jgi:hypothetical protein